MALMPGRLDTCVIVCESVHDVMALERALKDVGMTVEMIPTPRELTSDCGMALEVNGSELTRVHELQAARQLKWLGIFSRQRDGWKPVESSS